LNIRDKTGVKIVNLSELPAFRLNEVQRENFFSEFQTDLVPRRKDTVNTYMRASSMDRHLFNYKEDEPLTKSQKSHHRSVLQAANNIGAKKC